MEDSRGGENHTGRSCVIVGNVVGKDLPGLLVASGRALESVERSCQGSLGQAEGSKVAGTLSWCLMLEMQRIMLVCVDLTSPQSLLINTLLLALTVWPPATDQPSR